MNRCGDPGCHADHGTQQPPAGPARAPVQQTPEQIEMQKKIDLHRKELIAVANFVANKDLKFKNGSFNENHFEYFRGKHECLVTEYY